MRENLGSSRNNETSAETTGIRKIEKPAASSKPGQLIVNVREHIRRASQEMEIFNPDQNK